VKRERSKEKNVKSWPKGDALAGAKPWNGAWGFCGSSDPLGK